MLDERVNYTERKVSTRLTFVISFNTGNFIHIFSLVLLILQAFASHVTSETHKQLELQRLQEAHMKRQQDYIQQQHHKIQELQVGSKN